MRCDAETKERGSDQTNKQTNKQTSLRAGGRQVLEGDAKKTQIIQLTSIMVVQVGRSGYI
jgi:hypothetical protein